MADKNRKNVQEYMRDNESSNGASSYDAHVEKQNRGEDNSSRGTRNAEHGSRGAQYGSKGARSSQTNGWDSSDLQEDSPSWEKSTSQDWESKKNRNNQN